MHQYHPLRNLDRDPTISGQPKRLFRWLAEEARWKIGGEVIITRRQLGIELGRARTTVIEWEDELVKAGMLKITIEDHGKIRYQILSFFPGTGWDTSSPDPQTLFYFAIETRALDCREPSTKPDRLSGLVNETRQPAIECREPSTKPDSPHNISAHARCTDEEEDKLIFFFKSVSWDQIAHLFFKVWKAIYHSKPGIQKADPAEEDRELIISACVLSLALKDGDKWLKYSALAVKSQGDKARNPIALFRTCLIEKMVGYLGIGTAAESKSQFGRLLRTVRPKVNELWHSLDEELKIRKNKQTMREVNDPCSN